MEGRQLVAQRPWYAKRLPWQTKRADAATAVQRFLQVAPMLTAVLTVLFGAVPMLVVFVVGLAQGRVPSEGFLGSGSGYPIFEPPFYLLWIPGLIALVFALISVPVSGKFPGYLWGGRLEMITVSLFGFFSTLEATIAYDANQFSILFPLTGVWLLVVALVAIRAALGKLHLVPRAWR